MEGVGRRSLRPTRATTALDRWGLGYPAAAPLTQFTGNRAAAVGLAAPVYLRLPGHSGRAGSLRPLAQDGPCPHHDLKGHSVPRGVHGPEFLQAVVPVIQASTDSDYRQPPGTGLPRPRLLAAARAASRSLRRRRQDRLPAFRSPAALQRFPDNRAASTLRSPDSPDSSWSFLLRPWVHPPGTGTHRQGGRQSQTPEGRLG